MIVPSAVVFSAIAFAIVIPAVRPFPSIFNTNSESSVFEQSNTAPFKGFSGLRAFNRSTRFVYWHDQTIGVVELGPNRLLLNCELIEVYEPHEREETLENVREFAKPHQIRFEQMMDLMERCSRLETPTFAKRFTAPSKPEARSSSLFSGVIPGTKWCGTGDIADTYFDLGEEQNIDRCCRTHDLCPSKVRGYSQRYNLSNDNMYTKSHCKCDLQFQKCLKNTQSPTADIMGHFYFDLLKVQCIQDLKGGKRIIKNNESYS